MKSKKILSKAHQELIEIIQYYEQKHFDLGKKFLFEYDFSVNKIQRFPYSFPKEYRNIRRCVVRQFPYVVFYIVRDYFILIIAIGHMRRRPLYWKVRV